MGGGGAGGGGCGSGGVRGWLLSCFQFAGRGTFCGAPCLAACSMSAPRVSSCDGHQAASSDSLANAGMSGSGFIAFPLRVLDRLFVSPDIYANT